MQRCFAEPEYGNKKKTMRRERYLAPGETLGPWAVLAAQTALHYPVSEPRGQPPIGVERMLHMDIAQQCFGLPDEGKPVAFDLL